MKMGKKRKEGKNEGEWEGEKGKREIDEDNVGGGKENDVAFLYYLTNGKQFFNLIMPS